MAKTAKSWAEKMAKPPAPAVVALEKEYARHPAGTRMLISTPREIAAFVKDIPEGMTVSVAEMRDALAYHHQAQFACPLTTGIFLRIAAEDAWARLSAGAKKDSVMPFWRIVSPKDALAKKLSCGVEELAHLRRLEGIE
jgi:hypothetical protein